MGWLQSAFSSSSPSSSPSSSSPSPKSSADSTPKRNLKDVNYFFRSQRSSTNSNSQQPRLTRQRKLRHLTDLEVWPCSLVNQLHLSGNSTPASSASPGTARSSSAKPQPLPLPELAAFLRRDSGNSALGSGNFPLPSPKEGTNRGDAEESVRAEGMVGDAAGDGVPLNSPRGR